MQVLRSASKADPRSGIERWPVLWCFGVILIAGLVGWLGILTGLRALF